MIHKVQKMAKTIQTSIYIVCLRTAINRLILKFNKSVRKGKSAHFHHVLNHVRKSI